MNGRSRLWFTVSHGIVDEVYYPDVDRANTRDFGMLVSDGKDFFSEEKRNTTHQIEPLVQGVPAFQITNTCERGRYRITKIVLSDPMREVLLQQVTFEVLQGALQDYQLFALLAPHIGNRGYKNTGWTGDYKGVPMLFAQRHDIVMALACSAPMLGRSCGYVGVSDGWQDVHQHKRMSWFYPRVQDGNIALTAQVDLAACGGKFTLALGLAEYAAQAGQHARASLLENFEEIKSHFIAEWQEAQSESLDLGTVGHKGFDLYRVSTQILHVHQSKAFPGAAIASLSIPWGFSKGDDNLGGYHLVWPRDLVQVASALWACGDVGSAEKTLLYCMCTQEADGRWPQNMWIDGSPYWRGDQLDGTSLVILLADGLRQVKRLRCLEPWPVVRHAASYLVTHGPSTPQDRWEENAGLTPYTLSAEIAALLAAADFADEAQEPHLAAYLRETADCWNSLIEEWLYVTGTDLARQAGVPGYYMRIAPPESIGAHSPADVPVHIQNRPANDSTFPAGSIVSPDALALVRFGLRRADDPRVVNTVRVLDATLRSDTATGAAWHRYTHDGYGETADGRPYASAGIGRAWPLLGGERGHYELAAGNRAEAERLLAAMAAQSSSGGLIPEQIWDAPDIPQRELWNGHPTGSAMPLAWAHAEYVKLARSLHEGRVFDTPRQPVQRYCKRQTGSPFVFWRFDHQRQKIPAGKKLRIEVLAPAVVHWSPDNWSHVADVSTTPSGLGICYADLPTAQLNPGALVSFTFFWPHDQRWEGRNFAVQVRGT